MKSVSPALSTLHEHTRLPVSVAQWLKQTLPVKRETLEDELSAALDFVAVHGEGEAPSPTGVPDAVDE